jgi:hypothetical protein
MHTYRVNFGALSLVAATAKTIVQLATPSTRRATLMALEIGFDSTDAANAGATVELIQATTAGTGTSATPVAVDRADPAALCVGGTTATATNLTAEPGTITVLQTLKMTVVGSTLIYVWHPDAMPIIPVSAFVGVRVTAPQAQSGIVGSLLYHE